MRGGRAAPRPSPAAARQTWPRPPTPPPASSTDLADLVARARVLEERARAAGLEVRDGRVEIGWGVTGAADAEADRSRAATRAALQAELDLVLAQHQRRRDWVLGVLRDSTSALADVAHRRRGG